MGHDNAQVNLALNDLKIKRFETGNDSGAAIHERVSWLGE